jgi:hypothetical protein
MARTVEVGRLALRVEGEMWNAYWAPSQSNMDEAILLGSIRMNAVEASAARKNAFMELMKDAFGAAIKDVTGQVAQWNDPVRAPERERSGRS